MTPIERRGQPRSVIRLDGSWVVLREANGKEIEEFHVPKWVADNIYERGRRHDRTEGFAEGYLAGHRDRAAVPEVGE